MGRAFFSRSLLPEPDPAVCVSTDARLLRANAVLAVWRCGELDIDRTDGCRAFVHLVGAHSPWPSLVGPGGEEIRSPCRRHGALQARAPSDLFGPHLRRIGNRGRERNLIRAA